jgi:hypothetical protein
LTRGAGEQYDRNQSAREESMMVGVGDSLGIEPQQQRGSSECKGIAATTENSAASSPTATATSSAATTTTTAPATASTATVEPQDTVMTSSFFVSSFFIGLSFRSGLRSADVTAAVQDFLYRVNIWDGKKPGMEIAVEVCTLYTPYNFIISL